MLSLFLSTFGPWLSLIPLVGWVLIIVVAVKISWKASAFSIIGKAFMDKTEKVEDTVNLLATNHLPHLQLGIDANTNAIEKSAEANTTAIENLRDDLLAELRGLRSDLLQYALRKE
jgi:hypothetical protein